MQTRNIMIVGVGGQGTLIASRILGGIAVTAGYDVKVSEVHGMAQRGGSVVTFVRYGDKVEEPIVEEGCADVLIAFERLEAKRYAHFLKKDGVLIVNDTRIDPMPVVIGAAEYPENIIEDIEKNHTVYRADATAIAMELGNPRCFNVVILGMAARHMDYKVEDWYDIIERTVKPATVEVNKRAFDAGYVVMQVCHTSESGFEVDSCYGLTYMSVNVGTISFESASVEVGKGDPYVDVVLKRSASEGAVSVRCTTVAGTAKPGEDYYPISEEQTVSWADGDMADKTVRVRLIPSLYDEWTEDRSFQVRIATFAQDAVSDEEYIPVIAGSDSAVITIKSAVSGDGGR